MNNRCLALCCVALLLVLFNAAAVLLNLHKRSQIGPTPLADRIQLGQTRAQAVSAVGLSPGDYRTNSSVWYLYCGNPRKCIATHPTWQEVSWKFDRGEVVAFVNEEDVVVLQFGGAGFATRPAPWEYIRDILSWKVPSR